MAKKTFSAGTTKSGVLNNDGGEKLREMQAKAQYNFKYIPKEKIIPNPKNEQYTQDGIEALKESILVNGLRHNLSVLYDAETDLYRLISGERRYHAICQMTDKELRKLSRAELLDMLIQQTERNEELEAELKKAKTELRNRAITIENAGSLAEAALQINGVFEAADRAAKQYLRNVQRMAEKGSRKE